MTPASVYSWFKSTEELTKWLASDGWRAIGYRKVASGEQFVANSASPRYPPRDGSILDGPYQRARLVVVKIHKGDH